MFIILSYLLYNLSYSCGRYLFFALKIPEKEIISHLHGLSIFSGFWLLDPDCE